jgi:hypothetical protein
MRQAAATVFFAAPLLTSLAARDTFVIAALLMNVRISTLLSHLAQVRWLKGKK